VQVVCTSNSVLLFNPKSLDPGTIQSWLAATTGCHPNTGRIFLEHKWNGTNPETALLFPDFKVDRRN